MNIRDALINQSPSLALQRAAADEIARLDAEVKRYYSRWDDATRDVYEMEWYLETHDLTQDFEQWVQFVVKNESL